MVLRVCNTVIRRFKSGLHLQNKIPTLVVGIFVLAGQSPDFESVLRTEGEAESGSHTPLEDRKARFSGAECGYLPKAYPAYTLTFFYIRKSTQEIQRAPQIRCSYFNLLGLSLTPSI